MEIRLIRVFLTSIALTLIATTAQGAPQKPAVVLGDGSCLNAEDLPEGWSLAAADRKPLQYELVTRADLANPAVGRFKAAIIANSGASMEVVTYLPAASPGAWLTDGLFRDQAIMPRTPERDIGDFRAYRLEHNGTGYVSDDGVTVMDCYPGGERTPANCVVSSRALQPTYRLSLELPESRRSEAKAMVDHAVAMARTVLRPCRL